MKGESKTETNVENEDELIDINEFRKLIEDTFRPIKVTITEEMVQWNFNQIDKDSSGRISFDEFLDFIKKYNNWSLIIYGLSDSQFNNLLWC